MPFLHLNIKQKGKLSACWRFPDKIGDYSTDTLTETWNGEKLKDVRRASLNNEQHTGCRSCWDLESSGIKSTRENCNDDYKNTVNEESVRSIIDNEYNMPIENLTCIEVRFDNVCNLMCRHCSSDYSSKWDIAVQKDDQLKELMVEYGTYRESTATKNLNDRIIVEIGELSNNLDYILISGGEPLYHDKHYNFLENISKNAKNIKLSYNSNLTTLDYKGQSILELWKNFKYITIRVSIDGYPDIYEYVRTHKNLNKVEQNIKEVMLNLDNIYLSATCTTSILNITRITEIFEYFNSLGVYIHTSLVQYPEALNPKALPNELKKEITKKWNLWLDNVEYNLSKNKNNFIDLQHQIKCAKKYGNNVIDYMNSSDDYNNNWNKFIEYATVLDNYHGTDILETYPEFNSYWK
jgi:MoaA/NifB/PqqE/SkfB family radical SAM enzyme